MKIFLIFDDVKISKIKSKKSIEQIQKRATSKIEFIIEDFIITLKNNIFEISKYRQIKS